MGQNTEVAACQIKKICIDTGMAEHNTENMLNLFRASLPLTDESPHLPINMLTGFDPIDYLVAPLKNNTRIHIYGRAGSAKTSIIAHTAASVINTYGTESLWLDSTFKVNARFFKKFKIGERLKFLQTATISNEILNTVLSGRFRLIIIDDVASFKRESSTQLERLLYYCRIYKIMVLLANQVREIPKTGRIYASKQELLTSYDLTIRTMKYRTHYEQKYNDYDTKLEYHQGTGRMDGQSVVIPITTAGYIKEDLMNDRLDRISKIAGFQNFSEYIQNITEKYDQ